MTTTPHDKALSKAKIALMQRPDSTFFLTVCFSLPCVWDKNIQTACTNGKQIRFNPDFFMSLTPDEQLFLLLHETMHVAYIHMARMKERDSIKWNIAADYVINLQLVDRGFKMPARGLLDTKWANMSTEEVYKNLPDDPSMECPMEDLEAADCSDEEITREVEDILVRAVVASKTSNDKPGSIPGEIEIYINELLNPKLPWQRILQKYMQGFCKDDYSFKKFNRRFFPRHYLPSLHSEKLMDLAIAVDTSGSVSDEDFQVFVNEVAGIFRMMKPETITLIQFDTRIHTVTKLHSINELEQCRFSGRGGTYVYPVMDWIRENKPQLTLLFSDGEFQVPSEQTPGQLLWVIHNNSSFSAPFGTVIHYAI